MNWILSLSVGKAADICMIVVDREAVLFSVRGGSADECTECHHLGAIGRTPGDRVFRGAICCTERSGTGFFGLLGRSAIGGGQSVLRRDGSIC